MFHRARCWALYSTARYCPWCRVPISVRDVYFVCINMAVKGIIQPTWLEDGGDTWNQKTWLGPGTSQWTTQIVFTSDTSHPTLQQPGKRHVAPVCIAYCKHQLFPVIVIRADAPAQVQGMHPHPPSAPETVPWLGATCAHTCRQQAAMAWWARHSSTTFPLCHAVKWVSYTASASLKRSWLDLAPPCKGTMAHNWMKAFVLHHESNSVNLSPLDSHADVTTSSSQLFSCAVTPGHQHWILQTG